MDDNRKQEFINKLRQLLDEYDVIVGFKVAPGSDTWGLDGERVAFEDKFGNVILEVNGWWMGAEDIEGYEKVR